MQTDAFEQKGRHAETGLFACCEALRLFPLISINHKGPTQPDTLPSGQQVNKDAKIVLFSHAMWEGWRAYQKKITSQRDD